MSFNHATSQSNIKDCVLHNQLTLLLGRVEIPSCFDVFPQTSCLFFYLVHRLPEERNPSHWSEQRLVNLTAASVIITVRVRL